MPFVSKTTYEKALFFGLTDTTSRSSFLMSKRINLNLVRGRHMCNRSANQIVVCTHPASTELRNICSNSRFDLGYDVFTVFVFMVRG